MRIDAGTRIGPYHVLGKLGEGGMGEVYRARDTTLDRDVAIKVLPALFADDPDRRARFEREARSVAQLSHPNILAVHDFARDEGTAYVVLELLEGETLRERLAAAPLSARKAIEYGVQIARGLAAAHARGIIHRDLKPENLFITREDRIKILDFGLAKPIDAGVADVTGTVGTAAGLVMGTIGYMAPEQVRAQAVDHRADIFALGAVLYEMVSGRRTFGGDSPADTMSAILHADPPDLDSIAAAVPLALERIIRRCLEKKPELRFQSADDLAFALETLPARSTGATRAMQSEPVPGASRAPASVVPWIVAAVAIAVAAASWLMPGRPAPGVEPGWHVFTAITDMAGVETTPALSPDGTTIAYATRAHGSWDIYAQRVGGRVAVPLVTDPDQDESGPAFSPDGQRLAFHRGAGAGGIFVANAAGEAPRRVTDFGFHPSWSPDSRRIAFTTEEILDPYSRFGDSALWVVDAAGGAPTRIEGAGDAAQAAWSPQGTRIAFWSNIGGQRDIFTVPAGGGEPVAVTNDAPLDWSPAWAADGRHVYFASDRGGSMNIWRVAIDEASGQVRGEPEPVTSGVQAAAEMPAFARTGNRLTFRSRVSATNPVAIPFDPVTFRAGTPVVLNNSNTSRRPTSVSRDGRWLALANLGEPQEDIFVSGLDGSGMRRITDDAARDRIPVWSADGRSLYFYSNRGGAWGIWAIGLDGGGLRQIATRPAGLLYPLVSPDGRFVIGSGATGSYGAFLSRVEPGLDPATNLEGLEGTDRFFATSWAPDGTRIAGYFATESNTPQGVGVYDLRTRQLVMRLDGSTQYVVWLPDNRHLLYFALEGADLMVLDTQTRRATKVDVTLSLRDGGDAFAISPDARTIFYGGRREEADIWLIEPAQIEPRRR